MILNHINRNGEMEATARRCGNNANHPGQDVSPMPDVAVLGTCPGTIVLSHLLRFSHRPRRPHCIPPVGRPYEPEEHVGYTLVQAPVVTEQYDEIVIPDPPSPLLEALALLPELFAKRVSIVKAARAGSSHQQDHRKNTTDINNAVENVYNENGVSCWKYIKRDELDDVVFAEAYLDSVFGAAVPGHQLVSVRHGRGRRKLTGAEIDLSALRSVKKGLLEVIEQTRREATLQQATHIYHQYK
uniref:Uncharacterized protein TCIL3000_7_4450 n=1 Tax=Trypanosoma congolense (strain IL3000) TaxID=1068625 RepID=G0UQH0_TRYCI|nr:unnamed protein product [Trypanosoma congolense IL3000]